MSEVLDAVHYRRLLRVVEEGAHRAGSPNFRETVLEALDEHLGFRGSAFFVAGPPVPGFRALEGVVHGYAQRGLEEYTALWSSCEPFGQPGALARLRSRQPVSFAEVYEPRHRDYVDFWLRPQRIEGYTLLWLDCALPLHGYVSLLSDHEFGAVDAALLAALKPHLEVFLRRTLPEPKLAAALSVSEAEVANLVAVGRTNRDIARRLAISEDTVKKHVSRAMAKLRVKRRAQLALALGRLAIDSTFVQ